MRKRKAPRTKTHQDRHKVNELRMKIDPRLERAIESILHEYQQLGENSERFAFLSVLLETVIRNMFLVNTDMARALLRQMVEDMDFLKTVEVSEQVGKQIKTKLDDRIGEIFPQ
jgi:hypothetical protein